MARTARKKSDSNTYHIVLRGINKQTIFYDDEDKDVFLNRIKLSKEKYDFSLYAFCFMDNHVHILLREKKVEIGKIIQFILTSYVYWYNSKYERIGNLFQDRFKSEPIDDDSYLLSAIRYIHQNPIKAGLIQDISESKWSSHKAYLSDKESIVDKEFVLSMLQGKKQYVKFMAKSEEMVFLEPNERYKISDDTLRKEIVKKLDIKLKDLYLLSKFAMNDKIKEILEIDGSNPYQVSRVTGIPYGVIRGILN